jgi:hypothetical protein
MSAKTKKISAAALRKFEAERKRNLKWFEETTAYYIGHARKYPGSVSMNLLVSSVGVKQPPNADGPLPPGGVGGPHYNIFAVNLH